MGEVVRTRFGVGTLVEHRTADDMCVVDLGYGRAVVERAALVPVTSGETFNDPHAPVLPASVIAAHPAKSAGSSHPPPAATSPDGAAVPGDADVRSTRLTSIVWRLTFLIYVCLCMCGYLAPQRLWSALRMMQEERRGQIASPLEMRCGMSPSHVAWHCAMHSRPAAWYVTAHALTQAVASQVSQSCRPVRADKVRADVCCCVATRWHLQLGGVAGIATSHGGCVSSTSCRGDLVL